MQPVNVPDLTAHAVLAVAEYNSFIAAAAFLKTTVKRTLRFALHMSAYDPKRTWGQFHIGLGSTSMAKPVSWILVGISA